HLKASTFISIIYDMALTSPYFKVGARGESDFQEGISYAVFVDGEQVHEESTNVMSIFAKSDLQDHLIEVYALYNGKKSFINSRIIQFKEVWVQPEILFWDLSNSF